MVGHYGEAPWWRSRPCEERDIPSVGPDPWVRVRVRVRDRAKGRFRVRVIGRG